MTCACPPAGPYSELSCCRWNSDERCPPDRCLHPQSESQDLFDQYKDAVAMLAEAQARHRRAEEELRYSGDLCISLNAERLRLWAALEQAVMRERGMGAVAADDGAPGLVEALEGMSVNVMNGPVVNTLPDLRG